MKIEISVAKKTTTLRWQHLREKISIRLPGRVDAKYSEAKDVVVAAGTAGLVHIMKIDGNQIAEFSYGNTEKCRFYILGINNLTDLGICIVMAHDPEFNGERFWQHDINIESKTVGEPIDKWR